METIPQKGERFRCGHAVMERPLRSPLLLFFFLFIFLIGTNAPSSAAVTEWKVSATALQQLETTETEDLLEEALRASVPPELIDKALDLLFDKAHPDVVPDEIEAKRQLFALIVAQNKIREERKKHESFSEDDIRKKVSADIAGLLCSVSPASVAKAGTFYKDYVGELTSEEIARVNEHANKLDDYEKQIKASLKDSTGKTTVPDPPSRPDITNRGKESFDSLSKKEQKAVYDELEREALKGFSCKGGGCKRCRKSVRFETEEGILDNPEMQIYYRISAIPECSCSGR